MWSRSILRLRLSGGRQSRACGSLVSPSPLRYLATCESHQRPADGPTSANRRRLSVDPVRLEAPVSRQQEEEEKSTGRAIDRSETTPSGEREKGGDDEWLPRRDWTQRLQFMEPQVEEPSAPTFRVLQPDGELVGTTELTDGEVVELYKEMLTLNVMDKIMFESHRQGRISFYMTTLGEEATLLGSAAALSPSDWVFAQYRETGVLVHRRMDLKLMLAQCYGNKYDLGKGRQMPIHYGSRELNFVTISSPLATQMPQAVGAAYALAHARRRAAADDQTQVEQQQQHAGGTFETQMNDDDGQVVTACYFGEGAASEGDAHAALNFAATLDCPVLFLCRNNGYAISTPASEQFRGDGVVLRGLASGIRSLRVDGNDLLAVYAATKAARQVSARERRPALIEFMTYRVGHHSTSDDSSAYRSKDEVAAWAARDCPLARVRRYLEARGAWSAPREADARAAARGQVLSALAWAEKQPRPPVSSMFDDVYAELPPHLRAQRDELRAHLLRHPDDYPVSAHDGV